MLQGQKRRSPRNTQKTPVDPNAVHLNILLKFPLCKEGSKTNTLSERHYQ